VFQVLIEEVGQQKTQEITFEGRAIRDKPENQQAKTALLSAQF
jgi:hypothetical protein